MKQFFKQTSKIFTIYLFLLAFGSSANAQTKFGVQMGTSYNFESSDIGNYNFGAFVKMPLSTHWTVEPSLNIFPFGTTITTTESKTTTFYSEHYKKNITTKVNKKTKTKNDAISVNLPVLFAYRLNLTDMFGLQFGAGPYLNYLSSGKTTISTTTTTYQSFNNSTTTNTNEMEIDSDDNFSFGGMLRVGVLINRFSVNLDYTGYDSDSKKAFNSKSLMFRLGYHF